MHCCAYETHRSTVKPRLSIIGEEGPPAPHMWVLWNWILGSFTEWAVSPAPQICFEGHWRRRSWWEKQMAFQVLAPAGLGRTSESMRITYSSNLQFPKWLPRSFPSRDQGAKSRLQTGSMMSSGKGMGCPGKGIGFGESHTRIEIQPQPLSLVLRDIWWTSSSRRRT